MKTNTFNPSGRPHQAAAAFTIIEVMMTAAVFLLLIAATLSTQLFGFKMYGISQAKLTSTENARKVLSRVQNEIRAAQKIYVGNWTSSFAAITNANQTGNAIQIYADANSTNCVCYYRATNNCLRRVPSPGAAAETLAQDVTNSLVFQSQDCHGAPNTNAISTGSQVIQVQLQFRKTEYMMSSVDSYAFQTRIATRAN